VWSAGVRYPAGLLDFCEVKCLSAYRSHRICGMKRKQEMTTSVPTVVLTLSLDLCEV
jgi:hypothetical protein